VKNLPGRKTDVSDAAWLAQLGAHGLVRGSFVPPEPIRQLRDLIRTRTTMVRARAKEFQRLEKLEDAGIKLSSVATDISGVSGRGMLQALIDGEREPAALAELAKQRLPKKIPELTEAPTGRFSEHHAFLAWLHLDIIDQHTRVVDELTSRIELVITPFRGARDLMVSIQLTPRGGDFRGHQPDINLAIDTRRRRLWASPTGVTSRQRTGSTIVRCRPARG